MPEAQNYAYSHKELAELLVRQQGLTEGHWGIYLEFGMQGGNIPVAAGAMVPVAMVRIEKIGIQRFDKPNPLTVDAAEVNPKKEPKRSEARAHKI